MQFIVLIEFLIPGVATVLLCLALFPEAFSHLLKGVLPSVPAGETATALLLLVISYPVGHMVNYPVFQSIQRRLFTPWVRRATIKKFLEANVDLVKIVNHQVGIQVGGSPEWKELTKEEKLARVKKLTEEELWHLFGFMRAMALSRNSDYLDGYVFFYKSLQRLARGILCPLVLASLFVWQREGRAQLTFALVLVLVLVTAVAVCLHLLYYSLQAEEHEMVRFFVIATGVKSTGMETAGEAPPTQAVERMDTALPRDPAAHRQ